jgi:hypothetical protein
MQRRRRHPTPPAMNFFGIYMRGQPNSPLPLPKVRCSVVLFPSEEAGEGGFCSPLQPAFDGAACVAVCAPPINLAQKETQSRSPSVGRQETKQKPSQRSVPRRIGVLQRKREQCNFIKCIQRRL